MLELLKDSVYRANLKLPEYKLITFTWGNVSQIDRDADLICIKPSGVDYGKMTSDDMVIVDLEGRVIEGTLRPSSDLPTHIEIYRTFESVGGVVHTHSRWATIFAQAGIGIPALGTTHADYFNGEVPCTRGMTPEEIQGQYERETGSVIIERFKNLSPLDVPGVLVKNHGPFTWGKDAEEAVHNAVVLEEIAMMAWHTMCLNREVLPIADELLDKHYMRKHGDNAYYGQR